MTKAKPTKAKPNRLPASPNPAQRPKKIVSSSVGLDRLYAAAQQVGIECLDTEWRGNDARYRLRCAHGHEFLRDTSTLSNKGIICPECRDNARLARIQAAAAQQGGRCLETRYLGRSVRYRFVCAEGHQWTTLPGSIVHAETWCRRCATQHRKLDRAHDNGLELIQAAAQARGGTCLATVYKGSKALYQFRCAKGHEWEAIGAVIMRNRTWCPRCAPTHRLLENGLELIQAAAQARGGACLTSVYAGMRAHYVFRCTEGHKWEALGRAIIFNRTWCPRCAGPNHLLENGLELLQAAAQARGGSCLAPVYAGMKARYVFRCAEGHEWEAVGQKIAHDRTWCPLCAKPGRVRASIPPRLRKQARKSATPAKKNRPIKTSPAHSKSKHQNKLVALRKDLGLNQHDFWSALGVTQSGGSRYECGRRIPKTVAMLLDLVHVRAIDLAKLKREDMAVLQFMEQNHPDLYTALLKSVRAAPHKTTQ